MLIDPVCGRASDNVVVELGALFANFSVLVAVVAHAHKLGQSLIGHGCLLQVLGSLGCLLATVHEYQHLLLTRMPQHLWAKHDTFRNHAQLRAPLS